jgi:hypothetical protein
VSRVFIYKTYTIRSTPLQLLDSKQWMLSIVIDWERDGRVTGRPFSATENTYPTEAEADLHGITYGQRIIDGKVPGFSVG